METVTTEETTNLESVVCFPSEAIIWQASGVRTDTDLAYFIYFAKAWWSLLSNDNHFRYMSETKTLATLLLKKYKLKAAEVQLKPFHLKPSRF